MVHTCVQATREPMMRFLAACLDSNKERAKMQMDPRLAAASGFSLNLFAVLLHACEPFLADHAKAWGKLDAGCGPCCWVSLWTVAVFDVRT